jgi:RimK-like ATP-grasp domain
VVIIVSSNEDAHLEFVTKHLLDEYVVVDAGNILNGEELTFELQANKARIFYKSKELNDVTGVWLRRPRHLKRDIKIPVHENFEPYCRSAIWEHFSQVYCSFPEAVWLSDRFNSERAESKILQLQMAAEVGLHVPDTVITSGHQAAKAFVGSRPTSIVKSMSRTMPVVGDNRHFLQLYATKLTPEKTLSYDGLNLSPCIFQDAIEPAYDIRTTVVGDQVFSVKVLYDRQGEGDIRDWHLGYRQQNNIWYEKYTLPPGIARKCVRLVKKLGLQYGALDFVRDKKGKYWFIEINPSGQWAFMEADAGVPIGQAIAAVLEKRQS